jgi:phosphatidylglycerophosphatase GEP4
LPSQIAVVGDRLLTDMMLANMMGSYGIWIKDGVKDEDNPVRLVSRMIGDYEQMLTLSALKVRDQAGRFSHTQRIHAT